MTANLMAARNCAGLGTCQSGAQCDDAMGRRAQCFPPHFFGNAEPNRGANCSKVGLDQAIEYTGKDLSDIAWCVFCGGEGVPAEEKNWAGQHVRGNWC